MSSCCLRGAPNVEAEAEAEGLDGSKLEDLEADMLAGLRSAARVVEFRRSAMSALCFVILRLGGGLPHGACNSAAGGGCLDVGLLVVWRSEGCLSLGDSMCTVYFLFGCGGLSASSSSFPSGVRACCVAACGVCWVWERVRGRF